MSDSGYPFMDMTWASASGAVASPEMFLQPGERLHVSGIPGTPDHVQLIVTDVTPPDPESDDQTYVIGTRPVTEADG